MTIRNVIKYIQTMLKACALFNNFFYRHHLIKTGKGRYRYDGINNLHYKKLGIEYQYLHTRILVSINETKVMTVGI